MTMPVIGRASGAAPDLAGQGLADRYTRSASRNSLLSGTFLFQDCTTGVKVEVDRLPGRPAQGGVTLRIGTQTRLAQCQTSGMTALKSDCARARR